MLSRGMKYVIVDRMGCECPILFINVLFHDTFTENDKVIAAGEVMIYPGSEHAISCYGRSSSLDVDSRGEKDAQIIRRELFAQEY